MRKWRVSCFGGIVDEEEPDRLLFVLKIWMAKDK